jgi:hypothetical protein
VRFPQDGSSSAAAVGEAAQVAAALHTYLAGTKPNLEPVLQSRPKTCSDQGYRIAPLQSRVDEEQLNQKEVREEPYEV